MNPELQEFLYNTLAQLVSGVPIGTILSLIVYYALNKVKLKTAEFPDRAKALEKQVKEFANDVVVASSKLKDEVVSMVNEELNKFSKKADEYQKIVENYRVQLEEANKQNKVLIAQYEITMDVLKTYVCENKNAVISGLAKTVADKLTNYKEHAYMAQEIINQSPEIKEKAIFLIEHYPDALLAKLVEVPTEALEDMVKQYEEEKSQG
jgi:hypothetical protein